MTFGETKTKSGNDTSEKGEFSKGKTENDNSEEKTANANSEKEPFDQGLFGEGNI